jgi:hypothetical protein
MKCSDLEILICNYVDGTVSEAERATVELHLASCEACREMVADCRAALSFIERVEEVVPPPALVNKILFEVRNGAGDPVAKRGVLAWVRRLFEPLLQPKFAMGMAMTILSFSMLGRFAGVPVRNLKPSDLEPARVWATMEDKAVRGWERAKKYYESLRVVYEIQQTLNDWNQSNEDPRTAGGAAAPATPDPGTINEGPIPKRPQEEKAKATEGRELK